MRARETLMVGVVLLSWNDEGRANNATCWGDNSREDISCSQITERLLLSFRGETRDVIRKAMKAGGREIDGGLHFISNYGAGEKSGSGDVNVTFEGGRATNVNAAVDSSTGSHHQDFIWSAYAAPALGNDIDRSTRDFGRQPFCSDLSGKPDRCSIDGGMNAELTKMQMQGNMTKVDLLKVLNASCTPDGGPPASDPAGDCSRLRDLLQP